MRRRPGTAGTVEVAVPELDLNAGLVTLPAGLLHASTRLQERCTLQLGLSSSSFVVIGRGGVTLMPDDPASSPPVPSKK